jgi:protein SCO1/2
MRNLFMLALAGFVLLGSGCQSASSESDETSYETGLLPYYADENFTPHWFDSAAAVPADFHAIPSFSLTDQEGETVTEADLEGRITVANFFFTACPGICPATTGNMLRVQREFSNVASVALLSHSVTPEKDSLEALQAFAETTGVLAEQWKLVTGAQEVIYSLGKDAYFADDDLGETTPGAAFTHTESFYLLDGNRRIRGIYNGMNNAAVTQLIEDVRTLQADLVG